MGFLKVQMRWSFGILLGIGGYIKVDIGGYIKVDIISL